MFHSRRFSQDLRIKSLPSVVERLSSQMDCSLPPKPGRVEPNRMGSRHAPLNAGTACWIAIETGEGFPELGEVIAIGNGQLFGDVLPCGSRVFRGIPYARPPVGELRWRAPQPAENWHSVRDCTQFGPAPVQPCPSPGPLPLATERQSEDCLYLNIWTPTTSPAAPLPVIVWFHPGAYQMGSGSQPLWHGDTWAREGAVFVSFNHRLGKLGFLAHPDLCNENGDGLSGNYGLMDQLAALRWVRDNIDAFGGDPDCVTIFGVSSGASSVSLLMAIPDATGLFHRAIAESGGSFGPVGPSTGIGDRWQTLEGAVAAGARWARDRAKASNIDSLRAMSAAAICRAGKLDRDDRGDLFGAARPIVDGHLVEESPFACFARGHQSPIPLLTGAAAKEAMGMGSSLDQASHFARAHEEFGSRAELFLELYTASTDEQALTASKGADGDRLFTWQNATMARLHAVSGFATYHYRFEQAPPVDRDRSYGAFHGASIFYAFNSFGLRPYWQWDAGDRSVSQMLLSSWLAFARTGNPGCDALPDWPRHEVQNPCQMRIGATPTAAEIARKDHIGFWDDHYALQRRQCDPAGDNKTASEHRSISLCG